MEKPTLSSSCQEKIRKTSTPKTELPQSQKTQLFQQQDQQEKSILTKKNRLFDERNSTPSKMKPNSLSTRMTSPLRIRAHLSLNNKESHKEKNSILSREETKTITNRKLTISREEKPSSVKLKAQIFNETKQAHRSHS